MRRLPVIALLLLVAAAQPAAAKEPRWAKACGASGCREVKDRRLLAELVEAGPVVGPPAKAQPWYEVDITISEGRAVDHFSTTVLPGAMRIRGADGGWMRMTAQDKRAYARVTRGIEPYAADDMPFSDELDPPAPSVRDAGTPLWPWLAGGGAALLLALVGLLRRRLA